jgi:hypothetical protein
LQGIAYICHICSKKVSDERTLEMHIENTHLKTLEERERKFQCQVNIFFTNTFILYILCCGTAQLVERLPTELKVGGAKQRVDRHFCIRKK